MKTEDPYKKERDEIVKGLEETYRKLIQYKKEKKSPLVVIRNGKIVEVDPNEVLPTTSYKRNAG
jgi:imidazolonepropionase-like amidohydrolase